MMSVNRPLGANPVSGYYPTAGASPAPAPPAPTTPAPGDAPVYYQKRGLSPEAMLDLARVVQHPIQTVKSLYVVSRDLLALQGQRGLSIQAAEPALAQYRTAKANLDAAPFKHLIPFFDRALDRWADARFYELKPQVEAKVSERAWHPIQLVWPDGGSGHERLSELDMFNRVANTASDGQIVRALQGANAVRITNSTALDYFYPVARAGDALILRRNLPLVPGQKSIEESLTGLMNQAVQVHVQI